MGKSMEMGEGETMHLNAHHHPHLEAMRAEFHRHKIAWGIFGCLAGACIAGAIVATAGANGAGASPTTAAAKSEVITVDDSADGASVRWWWSEPAPSEPASEYCFVCDHAPSRGFGWAFGYGECVCEHNWQGACCDEAIDITLVTYGPFFGDKSVGGYELYTVHSDHVDEHMKWADCAGQNDNGNSVPVEFGGLWWMDGNPASDYVASFGASNWQSVASGYECENAKITNQQNDQEFDCLGGLEIPVFGEDVWSWHDESLGRLVYSGALGAKLTYKFECGGLDDEGKLTYCQVYPSAAIPFGGGWITVPANLVSFDMTRGNDDLWIRNSIIGGLDDYPHNYYLKNIVTCDGKHGHYWDEYVSGSLTNENLSKLKKPVPVSDVFGNGADERDLVSDVHHTSLLAKNIVPGA